MRTPMGMVYKLARRLGAVLVPLMLVACSGNEAAPEAATAESHDTLSVSFSAVSATGQAGREKTSTELIDPNRPWQTWSGNESPLYYDWSVGALRIPSAQSEGIAVGVQRIDHPLTQGVQYQLDVQATDDGAGAILFLFDWNGNLIAHTNDALRFASNGAPLTFTAPASVAGFYLQVQSNWYASASSTLSARLGTDSGVDTDGNGNGGPPQTNDGELVSLHGGWHDWSNQSAGVFHDSEKGQLLIPPAFDTGNKLGIGRYQTQLVAGTQYELSVGDGSDSDANVALFLLDSSGQTIHFSDVNGNSGPWIAANTSGTKRFWPPAGVTGFIVQVQSGYRSQNWAQIRPSLKAVSAGGGGNGGDDVVDEDNGNENKPRVIVVSDINNSGGDPDDKQSMAHIMWYANELDIRGILPQLWNGHGYNVTMESLNAYEQDYWANGLSGKGYPTPQSLKDRVAYSHPDAIDMIIREADASNEPLYVLLWGGMTPVRDALYRRPDLVSKLRLLSIASGRMNDAGNCSRENWNGGGRNDIYNDSRFNNLWWVESNWTYFGMFTGDRPGQILNQLSDYGSLGWYQKQAVSGDSWAQYFRAGDTPTVLYLIDPDNNLDDPTQGSWAGQFRKPFAGQRPNYYTDSGGSVAWDYWNPCNTWHLMNDMFNASKVTLEWKRESMYSSLIGKLNWIYNR